MTSLGSLKRTHSVHIALTALAFAVFSIRAAQAEITRLEESYAFLVSDQAKEGGALYMATAGTLAGSALPLSFHSNAEYWGGYVCQLAKNSCAVKDVYNAAQYTLLPEPGLAGDLQTERINTHTGTNIYDAATWQIAVVLGSVANKFTLRSKQDAYDLASNQNRLLKEGYSGNATQVASGANRATTKGTVFRYNNRVIAAVRQAYSFRMIGRAWSSTDPLMGTRYQSLISAGSLPLNNADYRLGQVTWSDWKPITGENAWGFFIGPLQAATIHHVQGQKNNFVPFNDQAVQNALDVLPTFAAMQSRLGAVYSAPSGTLANQGTQTISPYQVSLENCFSVYAGLRILDATLKAQLAHQTNLKSAERSTITAALRTIRTMIDGGAHNDGSPSADQSTREPSTAGLLSFFKNYAWRGGEFVQGGLANDPKEKTPWTPTLTPKAIDANTWGVAALGANQVDQWFGYGASYESWQRLKRWGAYGVESKLWGVGYSDQDGNGMTDNVYRQGVLSSEWTAGAINMVRNLIDHYQRVPAGSADRTNAERYVKSLMSDEVAMLDAVQSLRWDKYQTVAFPGKPPNIEKLVTQRSQPYVYASKRYMIPFGWYANPLPSTCSTAWIIMLANRYDPFGVGGKSN